jgi:2-oxoglutarate/2-oxoacid ferredoxin oxidoreductase subunit alpha
MARELMEGNQAIAEAAIRYGLQAYFGYPITPQTEMLEWMSKRMPELGRAYVQAESELGAINMCYGAACTGARVMTSSSGPGISLMMEGISYIAATEVPFVLVDVMRGGPGLGNIAPAQSDYTQIVHGGGHGDYHPIVLAPASIQESVDLIGIAFDLAEKYRSVAVILIDGSLAQMMEPVELPPMQPVKTNYPAWAVRGEKGRPRKLLTSIYLNPPDEEQTNLRLLKTWMEVEANEVRYQEYYMDDARYVVVGFGSSGRIALSAVRAARSEGIPVGLLRPISVHPFPTKRLAELSKQAEAFLVVEMNTGQMLDDVLMAAGGQKPVEFFGRLGGVIPFPDEILVEIRRLVQGGLTLDGNPRQRWLECMLANN